MIDNDLTRHYHSDYPCPHSGHGLRVNHFHAAVGAVPQVPQKETSMRLSELREGQTGIVDRVKCNGSLRRRILEMGILKGTEVYVEKYAPLKDPLELIVKGYHISLRVKEANQITVEKVK